MGRLPRLLHACAAALAMIAAGVAHAQDRPEVLGTEAAILADHPLAAVVGADVLRRGGNAVDAAVAMAAVLAVVQPHTSGLGGDGFLLIREGRSGRVHALNGSGRAPRAATPAAFRQRGLRAVPSAGVLSVTVPGAVRAWADALRRHGTMDLASALAPAIRYASQGFPVSARLAADISANRETVRADAALAATFLPGGEPPRAGTLLRQPDLARSLQLIAREGPDAFYAGDIAREIDAFMAAENGLLRIDDLADHSSTWQQPITADYAGHRILAFPPNSQGAALLVQMNMAGLYDLRRFGHNTVEYVHALVEVNRIALAERNRHISDPSFAEIPLDRLLSTDYARELTARGTAGITGVAGTDGDGDTVFLAVVDGQGNAVALIQSLFHPFGSGRMVPGTGIVLHNRASAFSLDDGHVNVIAPRKRTRHALAPAMALRQDGSLMMVFGSPGGDAQTQVQLQLFNNIALFGMSAQQAAEAPRWHTRADGTLQLDPAIPATVRERLVRLGHRVRPETARAPSGGAALVILVSPDGVRSIGVDPARDAYGIAW